MPQFDLANFVPQLAWLAILFAILYFGVVRPTLPKVGRVIESREAQVNGDIATAEAAKQEADRMAAEHDRSVAEAQERARAQVNKARAAAATELEHKLRASNEALAARADAAQQELSRARDVAMAQIETVAAEAASDIVEKLTGKRPGATDSIAAARAALG